MKHKLLDFGVLTAGTAMVSLGVYFFKFPNNFSMGGVSGLSILLGQVIPVEAVTPGLINLVLSVFYLILGFLVLDKGFGARTVYCSLLYSILIQLLEWFCPLSGPLTDEKMLELFFAVMIPAFGAAFLFNANASTGGSDIMALILKKYTGWDVGRALLVSDVLIAAAALFIFDVETGLFSLLGLVLKSVIVDSAIESFNRRKSFTVVTQNPEPVCQFINQTLHRGATLWEAQGAYTQQTQHVILTALSRHQAVLLRNYLRSTDPNAFMLITNSSEIFGKGFLRV